MIETSLTFLFDQIFQLVVVGKVISFPVAEVDGKLQ